MDKTILEVYLKSAQGITEHDLENIEEMVLDKGVSGAHKAISILREMGSKIDNDKKKLDGVLAEAEKVFKTISVRTLNHISTMSTYKRQIKKWNNERKITDTVSHVKNLILHVENELNKEIQNLKMNDARIRHQKEKTIIMDFYRKNKDDLKKIFDLQKLLIEAKIIVLRNWSD